MASDLQIDGLLQEKQALESLMMKNPAMEKKVQKLIRKVLTTAKRAVTNGAKSKMKADPRHAYKAVKSAVYRRILGGNVSLLDKRNGKFDSYEPPRTLQAGQRGGNRRPRSQDTDRRMHYRGEYRGFILRFLNSGTQGRVIKFNSDPHRSKVKRGSQGGNLKKYGKTTNTGRRGSIGARGFFSQTSHTAMQQAAEQLSVLIDNLIKNETK